MNNVTTEQVESLIQVASRLIDLMNREVGFLRNMQVKEIEPLQADKATLTTSYEQLIRNIGAESGALKTVAPALREELAEVASNFDAALAHNLIALNGVRESHDRMMKAIVEAATEQKFQQTGYGNDAMLGGGRTNSTAEALSISLDQRL